MKTNVKRILGLLLVVCMIAGLLGASISFPEAKAAEACDQTVPPRVFYNNDFSENADGITIKSFANNMSEYDKDGKYLYLREYSTGSHVAFWNKGTDHNGVLDLPDQFVVSFDIAAETKWSNWELHLLDKDGDNIRVISNNGRDNNNKFLYVGGNGYSSHIVSPPTDGSIAFSSIAIAFDMEQGTYSYKFTNPTGGSAYASNLILRTPASGNSFDGIQYIGISSRGDKENGSTAIGGSLIIDNLKIYEGTEVLEDVGPQNQPEDTECELYSNDFSEGLGALRKVGYEGNKSYWDETNGYLYIRGHVESRKLIDWNCYAVPGYPVTVLPNEFTVSFDYAALNEWSTWEFRIMDGASSYIRVLSNSGDDVLNHLYKDSDGDKYYQAARTASAEGNVKFYPISMTFDMTKKTYSFTTVDGNGKAVVMKDLALRNATKSDGKTTVELGTNVYFAITSRGDDVGTAGGVSVGGNLILDNFKVSVPHTYTNECDPYCDVCKETVRWSFKEHVDTDNDHNCDRCGGVMSKCEDADKDHICDICSVYSGVDTKYDPMTMVVPFAFDVNPNEAEYVAKFTNLTSNATTEVKTWGQVGEKWCVSLTGITAKQLADEYDVVVTDPAGTTVATFENVSMREYSVNVLQNGESKKVHMDLLNYAAAAQNAFGYNTGSLANVGCDTNLGTQGNVVVSNGMTTTNTDLYKGTNLRFGDGINMLFRFDIPGNTMAKFTWTDYAGVAQETTVTADQYTCDSGYFVVELADKLSIMDYDSQVTCTIYQGEDVLVSVTDSIAWNVARMQAKDNVNYVALYENFYKYAVSAKEAATPVS